VSERVEPVPEQTRPCARSAGEAAVEPVVNGVIRLVLPLPYTETATVNAYLLERREGWCLVDCGSSVGPGWEALERALGLAGVEPAAIELLVCTHAHADHYGLAAEMMERCGCPLALAPGTTASADWIRDPPVPLQDRLALARRAGVPPELQAAAVSHPGDDGLHPRPGPDVVLHEGDTVETLAGAWRVVPAPGHSPTQVVLLEERSGMLLSADLVLGGPIPYLEYDYTPDPWLEHRGSLLRARALEPRLLLPGHGRPTDAADARIAGTLAAVEAAPERLLAAVAVRPSSAFGAAEAVLGEGAPFYQRQMALAGAMCILERLVDTGAAAAADDADGARRYRALQRDRDPWDAPLS
jgi:glyoxylase-like metal-dependent hydrolase (beta-lactamase superfamily II)